MKKPIVKLVILKEERLKDLKSDPSGIALRMTRPLDFYSNDIYEDVMLLVSYI